MGHLLPQIIRELVLVMEKLKPKEIVIKGNLPEGQLLSKLFRWARYSHPPIYCMKRLQVPAPDKLLVAVKQQIISPLVKVVCCFDSDHMVDHAGSPRPEKTEVPLRYPKQEYDDEGKLKIDRGPCQDFLHCAGLEPLYYVLFGLEGKRQLWSDNKHIPLFVNVDHSAEARKPPLLPNPKKKGKGKY